MYIYIHIHSSYANDLPFRLNKKNNNEHRWNLQTWRWCWRQRLRSALARPEPMTCKKVRRTVDVFVGKKLGESWENNGKMMWYVDRMGTWWDMLNKQPSPKVPNVSLGTWDMWGQRQTAIKRLHTFFGIFSGTIFEEANMCKSQENSPNKRKHDHRKTKR